MTLFGVASNIVLLYILLCGCLVSGIHQKGIGPSNHNQINASPTVPNQYVRASQSSNLEKRRIRPSQTRTYSAPQTTQSISFLIVDFVWTQKDVETIKIMGRMCNELAALMVLGLDFEPRHDIHLRLGAFNLDLYGAVEVLTMSIVLSVVDRITQLALQGMLGFGTGEVVVGAGVRVLFAASIQLQGLEDVYVEVVQRLAGYIG